MSWYCHFVFSHEDRESEGDGKKLNKFCGWSTSQDFQ